MADAAPLVSIVTIFYNPPKGFFEEAIASVRAQSEPRWELLLVDDGSTDTSGELARRAAAADPERIRVLTHEGGVNRGMSASRNLGIRAAHGNAIAFLDADDVYLPEKLERQMAHLDAHPDVDVVYGPTPHWWSWSGRPEDLVRDHARRLGVEPDRVVRPPALVRAFLEGRADTPATCGVLVRASAIAAVGGFEPRFVDLYEDQAFFFKLLLGHTAFVEGRAWDRYRRHPAAMCEVRIRAGQHSDDDSPTAARGAFLSWLEDHFRTENVTDAALWRSLDRARWPFRHPHRYRLGRQLRNVARAVLPAPLRRAARRYLGLRA